MRTYSLQEYFYYTRLERNAGIVLCLLCAIVYSLPLAYPLFLEPIGKIDFSQVQRIAAALAPASLPDEAGGASVAFRGYENKSPRQVESFAFDPNTATKDEFTRLGLSPRTAQTVLNFRAKGGRFYKKEDLKKIYGLRAEDYERLQAFVQLPAGGRKFDNYSKPADNQEVAAEVGYKNQPSTAPVFAKKSANVSIDINAATAEDWQQIRGIGPGWAKRIVNYREKLGGFLAPQQVGETFGLPDSVFQKMLPQMQANTPVFRRIKLNAATLDELKMHPYLSSFQATILFNYRVQHGNYTDFVSVKKVKAGFKDEDWRRLEPYFSFE